MANLSHRGTGEGKEYTLMENIYVDYLDKHPSLKSKQTWLDRQLLSNGKLSTYIAYFYILQYENCENQYVGIVESTRPHSGTYIYMLPNNHVRLYSYIYKRHFEEPFIRRKPDQEYIDIIARINRNLEFEDEDYTESKLSEDLEKTIKNPFKPIKCRKYFFKEIPHTNITEWGNNIESTIKCYLTKRTNPSNLKYQIDSNWDLSYVLELNSTAYNVLEYDIDYYYEAFPIIEEEKEIYKEEMAYKEKEWMMKKEKEWINKEEKWIKRIKNLKEKIKSTQQVGESSELYNKDIEQREAAEIYKEEMAYKEKQWRDKEKQLMKQIKRLKKKIQSAQQSGEFSELYDKDIKQIAGIYHISPIDLLLKINRQKIKSIHINSVTDVLNSKQVRLCKQIFEELSKKQNIP